MPTIPGYLARGNHPKGETSLTRSFGIELPGLARMAEVTRAISEAAARGPEPAPPPMRILTSWVAPAPGEGRSVTFANRAVMAPMPTGTADTDGLPGADTIAWYVARARGGTGLIVVEPTYIAPVPLPDRLRPLVSATGGAWSAFAELAESIHAAGSVPAISLDHPDPRPLTAWSRIELADVVHAFGVAASAAARAGFSALHLSLDSSAYLGRSLRRELNQRTDRYGRGPSGRLQLAREVVAAAGLSGLPVIVRVPCPASPVGSKFFEFAASIAASIVDAGANVIEVAPGPQFDDPSLPLLAGNGEAVLSTQVRAITERLKAGGRFVPVVMAGRIASPPGAEAALAIPGVEAVAIGRALIADPAWLGKVRSGVDSEIVPCIGCLACLDRTSDPRVGCVTNGDAGHEADVGTGVGRPLQVTVLGSGLPALEFARVAASRGHSVTVVPDHNPLGGITGLRSGVPGNAEFGRASLGAFDRLRDLGVVVSGSVPPSADVTVDGRPPEELPVRWGSGRNVLRAGAVLGRDLHQMYGIGRRVVVCGPGALAAEVALFLAGWGRRPTVVVPGTRENPFPDVHPLHGARLLERLSGYKCDLVTGSVPVEWHDSRDRKSRIVVLRDGEETSLGPFQTAVDCEGWPLPNADASAVRVLGDSALAPALRQLVRAAIMLARTI